MGVADIMVQVLLSLAQGDMEKEKEHGLPAGPLMDRKFVLLCPRAAVRRLHQCFHVANV